MIRSYKTLREDWAKRNFVLPELPENSKAAQRLFGQLIHLDRLQGENQKIRERLKDKFEERRDVISHELSYYYVYQSALDLKAKTAHNKLLKEKDRIYTAGSSFEQLALNVLKDDGLKKQIALEIEEKEKENNKKANNNAAIDAAVQAELKEITDEITLLQAFLKELEEKDPAIIKTVQVFAKEQIRDGLDPKDLVDAVLEKEDIVGYAKDKNRQVTDGNVRTTSRKYHYKGKEYEASYEHTATSTKSSVRLKHMMKTSFEILFGRAFRGERWGHKEREARIKVDYEEYTNQGHDRTYNLNGYSDNKEQLPLFQFNSVKEFKRKYMKQLMELVLQHANENLKLARDNPDALIKNRFMVFDPAIKTLEDDVPEGSRSNRYKRKLNTLHDLNVTIHMANDEHAVLAAEQAERHLLQDKKSSIIGRAVAAKSAVILARDLAVMARDHIALALEKLPLSYSTINKFYSSLNELTFACDEAQQACNAARIVVERTRAEYEHQKKLLSAEHPDLTELELELDQAEKKLAEAYVVLGKVDKVIENLSRTLPADKQADIQKSITPITHYIDALTQIVLTRDDSTRELAEILYDEGGERADSPLLVDETREQHIADIIQRLKAGDNASVELVNNALKLNPAKILPLFNIAYQEFKKADADPIVVASAIVGLPDEARAIIHRHAKVAAGSIVRDVASAARTIILGQEAAVARYIDKESSVKIINHSDETLALFEDIIFDVNNEDAGPSNLSDSEFNSAAAIIIQDLSAASLIFNYYESYADGSSLDCAEIAALIIVKDNSEAEKIVDDYPQIIARIKAEKRISKKVNFKQLEDKIRQKIITEILRDDPSVFVKMDVKMCQRVIVSILKGAPDLVKQLNPVMRKNIISTILKKKTEKLGVIELAVEKILKHNPDVFQSLSDEMRLKIIEQIFSLYPEAFDNVSVDGRRNAVAAILSHQPRATEVQDILNRIAIELNPASVVAKNAIEKLAEVLDKEAQVALAVLFESVEIAVIKNPIVTIYNAIKAQPIAALAILERAYEQFKNPPLLATEALANNSAVAVANPAYIGLGIDQHPEASAAIQEQVNNAAVSIAEAKADIPVLERNVNLNKKMTELIAQKVNLDIKAEALFNQLLRNDDGSQGKLKSVEDPRGIQITYPDKRSPVIMSAAEARDALRDIIFQHSSALLELSLANQQMVTNANAAKASNNTKMIRLQSHVEVTEDGHITRNGKLFIAQARAKQQVAALNKLIEQLNPHTVLGELINVDSGKLADAQEELKKAEDRFNGVNTDPKKLGAQEAYNAAIKKAEGEVKDSIAYKRLAEKIIAQVRNQDKNTITDILKNTDSRYATAVAIVTQPDVRQAFATMLKQQDSKSLLSSMSEKFNLKLQMNTKDIEAALGKLSVDQLAVFLEFKDFATKISENQLLCNALSSQEKIISAIPVVSAALSVDPEVLAAKDYNAAREAERARLLNLKIPATVTSAREEVNAARVKIGEAKLGADELDKDPLVAKAIRASIPDELVDKAPSVIDALKKCVDAKPDVIAAKTELETAKSAHTKAQEKLAELKGASGNIDSLKTRRDEFERQARDAEECIKGYPAKIDVHREAIAIKNSKKWFYQRKVTP
jgi:hypothetical protein